jgi:hypothetical protein
MQSGDQMAAVDLTDAGDSSALIGIQCLQKQRVLRNIFQDGQEFIHNVSSTRQRGKGEKSPFRGN